MKSYTSFLEVQKFYLLLQRPPLSVGQFRFLSSSYHKLEPQFYCGYWIELVKLKIYLESRSVDAWCQTAASQIYRK